MVGQDTWTVFLSYTSSDEPLVRAVYEELHRAGLSAWFDREEILAGDRILRKIEEGIAGSLLLLLFISRESLSSKWCSQELEYMQHRELTDDGPEHTRILPYLIDSTPITELPAFLRTKRVERLDPNNKPEFLAKVSADVQAHVQRRIATSLHRSFGEDGDPDDGPIYICVDLPTGLRYPDLREELWHELPGYMVDALGEEIIRPVVGAIASWWYEENRKSGHEDAPEENENSIIGKHWSSRTTFFLIPQKSPTEQSHPLHGMLITLIVFQGCRQLEVHGLSELEDLLLSVHPHADDPAVRDNLGVTAVLRPEDCFSRAATLALLVKRAFG